MVLELWKFVVLIQNVCFMYSKFKISKGSGVRQLNIQFLYYFFSPSRGYSKIWWKRQFGFWLGPLSLKLLFLLSFQLQTCPPWRYGHQRTPTERHLCWKMLHIWYLCCTIKIKTNDGILKFCKLVGMYRTLHRRKKFQNS